MSVIAIDFDSTLARTTEMGFPEIGEPVPYAIPIVNRLHASGHMIIIWTCRGGDNLTLVKEWLATHGVKYRTINYRHNTVSPSPKVVADLYIDDRTPFCPLVPTAGGREYVDWLAMEIWLKNKGYYTIPLGASND